MKVGRVSLAGADHNGLLWTWHASQLALAPSTAPSTRSELDNLAQLERLPRASTTLGWNSALARARGRGFNGSWSRWYCILRH